MTCLQLIKKNAFFSSKDQIRKIYNFSGISLCSEVVVNITTHRKYTKIQKKTNSWTDFNRQICWKKITNKKRKTIKEKRNEVLLFILYNLRDFGDVFRDKKRKRIKEKLIKLSAYLVRLVILYMIYVILTSFFSFMGKKTVSHFCNIWNCSITIIRTHFAICKVRSDNPNPAFL